MKKLLIASLVLAMLIVFSGVANAQTWWKSKEIQHTVTLTAPIGWKGNTILHKASGTFSGYAVAKTNGVAAGTFTVNEVFMCGTLTTMIGTLYVWIDYPGDTTLGDTAFSLISTDTKKEPAPAKTDHETGKVIGIGTFYDQTNGKSGPSYFKGTMTFKEDSNDNIESVTVKGTTSGGYAQGTTGVPYPGQSTSPSVRAVLTPYTFTTGTTLTCIDGIVEEQ
jgi:hypothetical protein